jgi:serine/threonine protein kinase
MSNNSSWKKAKTEIVENFPKQYTPIEDQRKCGGTHGLVILCKDTVHKRNCAIKKISSSDAKEGIEVHAIREIAAYKRLNSHPNIIELYEVIHNTPSTKPMFLIFEAMHQSLKHFMRDTNKSIEFDDSVKLYLKKQITNGVSYCHQQCIMHRDIKPENILISTYGNTLVAKLCDFGLAKRITRNTARSHSLEAVTLWYRAPEILLGQTHYNEAIDIWSLGCVFWEIDFALPIFAGDSEIDTLMKIYRYCGSPNEESFPGVSSLKFYNADISIHDTKSVKIFQAVNDTLYSKIFDYNIKKRPNAFQILMLLYSTSLSLSTVKNTQCTSSVT